MPVSKSKKPAANRPAPTNGTEPFIERVHLTDLLPDPQNANLGTERGLSMLDDSMSEVGLARGVFVDKNRVLLGGNKTHERAVDRGFDEAIIVHTTGNQLVVTQRDDLDLTSEDPAQRLRARRAAYYDNRVGEVDLSWNREQLLHDIADGVDFSSLFGADEFRVLIEGVDPGDLRDEDDDDSPPSAGTLLALAHVTKAEPTHVVEKGERWRLGRHLLCCAEVMAGWEAWTPLLRGSDAFFIPYAGPFAALTLKADVYRLVLVQPDPYICGHILDRWVEIHGESEVGRDG